VTDYVNHIADLAKEVEAEDPIDWGMLPIDEDEVYRLMALHVVETMAPKYDQPEFRDVMLATVVKLVVENFVLNLKLKER
jgi:hypothetical protein